MSIHSSLAIEANSLSIDQIRDIIKGKQVLGSKREIQEVKNAYKAYEMISKFDRYNQEGLLKAHNILTSLIIPNSGKYRTHQEGVFDGNKVIFMAPPHDMIHSLMNNLFEWLRSDNETPIIIKSCIFHYELLFIHPFSDGNGRTARLWQNVLLSKWNKLFEYIPIETQIKEYQDKYYEVIDKCNNSGDSNLFIEFMLKVIDKTLSNVLEYSQNESRNISEQVNRLLDIMEYDIPLSSNQIMDKLGVKSKETLRKSYLNPALKNGLIKMTIPSKPNSKNQKYYK